MDKITLCGIECRVIIGTEDRERLHRQKVTVDLEMFLDLGDAGRSDRLDATVDYSAVEKAVVELAETSDFRLLEALATAIGEKTLHFGRIRACRVRVFKEAASRHGRGVAVEMAFPRT
ncbi:MAG: dihydroneopterin aldolase [Victivallaceae bacterium]|nr:dihydroneopterin aldolase [Victivallaceae bacterium]